VAEGEFSTAFERVDWQVESPADTRLQTIPALTAEVLFYAAREAVRNAARHARSPKTDQPLYLSIRITAQPDLEILIEDNGQGLVGNENSSGGLAMHGTLMAVVGGSLTLESQPGAFTRVRLQLPALRAE
jgi:signal transduction histidine kinase